MKPKLIFACLLLIAAAISSCLAAALSSPFVLGPSPAPRPFVSQRQHDRYQSLIPDGVFTEDERERLVFYDAETTPQVFQAGNQFLRIDGGTPNPNGEFPWRTGGMDNSDNGHSYKALLLPEGQPIVGRSRHLPGDLLPSLVGSYPIGTKLIEVMLVGGDPKSWDGWHVFEVRILEKRKGGDPLSAAANWKPRWFRAVRSSAHLTELVREGPYELALDDHYREGLEVKHLFDQGHERAAFNAQTITDDLPPMPQSLLKRVHGRPFTEVTDRPWIESKNGWKAFAGSGGPFPRNYQGNFFKSDVCLQCHATVQARSSDFNRAWPGRVRGTDGIFSLPMGDGEGPARWSRKLTDARLLVVEK